LSLWSITILVMTSLGPRRRLVVRLCLALGLLVSATFVGEAYVTRGSDTGAFDVTASVGDRIAAPANGTTVITTQTVGKEVDFVQRSGDSPGELLAIDPNGTLSYYDNRYYSYWDVDPEPGTSATVLYVASEFRTRPHCGEAKSCFVNHIETANLSTGERTTLYSQTVRSEPSIRWHDVDRVGPDTFLVADIHLDRVFVINVTSGLVEWGWEVQSDYDVNEGGEFPTDWTHLNDVELIDDGRVMVGLRNQDTVAFVDPETGLDESWSLGSNDDYDVLNEQHNPDYIPAERGGPAVLVSDSDNHRIVEYQRVGGQWEQSWVWTGSGVNWPRDADRLPNGHTLVTDTNSNRVVEVNRAGDVVWEVSLTRPYEAERFETGDESATGNSAASLGLESRIDGDGGPAAPESLAGRLAASPVYQAVLFVLPWWMGIRQVLALLAAVAFALVWLGLEFSWSDRRLPRPPSLGGDRSRQ
jgi:hypothetical protein